MWNITELFIYLDYYQSMQATEHLLSSHFQIQNVLLIGMMAISTKTRPKTETNWAFSTTQSENSEPSKLHIQGQTAVKV